MGQHTLEVALEGHLLHQRPTPIGVSLQPERPGEGAALPAQTAGGRDLQWPLQPAPAGRGAQFRLQLLAEALPLQARALAGGGCQAGFSPHLPLRRMGHHHLATVAAPGQGDLFRRFEARKGAEHLPLQLQRLRQRQRTPTQLQLRGAVTLAASIHQLQRATSPFQPQWRLPQMSRQRHPELRPLGPHRRRRWHGRADQRFGRATAPSQEAQGQNDREGGAAPGRGGGNTSERRQAGGGPATGAGDGLRP